MPLEIANALAMKAGGNVKVWDNSRKGPVMLQIDNTLPKPIVSDKTTAHKGGGNSQNDAVVIDSDDEGDQNQTNNNDVEDIDLNNDMNEEMMENNVQQTAVFRTEQVHQTENLTDKDASMTSHRNEMSEEQTVGNNDELDEVQEVEQQQETVDVRSAAKLRKALDKS